MIVVDQVPTSAKSGNSSTSRTVLQMSNVSAINPGVFVFGEKEVSNVNACQGGLC